MQCSIWLLLNYKIYIHVFKLPNGEALDLENLKTYNMADFESGKMPQAVGEEEGGQEKDDDAVALSAPRSADAAVEAAAAAENR